MNQRTKAQRASREKIEGVDVCGLDLDMVPDVSVGYYYYNDNNGEHVSWNRANDADDQSWMISDTSWSSSLSDEERNRDDGPREERQERVIFGGPILATCNKRAQNDQLLSGIVLMRSNECFLLLLAPVELFYATMWSTPSVKRSLHNWLTNANVSRRLYLVEHGTMWNRGTSRGVLFAQDTWLLFNRSSMVNRRLLNDRLVFEMQKAFSHAPPGPAAESLTVVHQYLVSVEHNLTSYHWRGGAPAACGGTCFIYDSHASDPMASRIIHQHLFGIESTCRPDDLSTIACGSWIELDSGTSVRFHQRDDGFVGGSRTVYKAILNFVTKDRDRRKHSIELPGINMTNILWTLVHCNGEDTGNTGCCNDDDDICRSNRPLGTHGSWFLLSTEQSWQRHQHTINDQGEDSLLVIDTLPGCLVRSPPF